MTLTATKPNDASPASLTGTLSSVVARRNLRTLAPLLILIVLVAAIGIIEPSFIVGGGIRTTVVQALPVLFLALGQMIVMLLGGLDLSNAALSVFSGIVLAMSLGPLGAAAPVLSLLVVTLAGALNGFLSARFQVPTFAVTLGALGVYQAASLLLSNETTVYVEQNLGAIEWMLNYRFAGLELAAWVGLAICAGFWVLLRWTVFGQNLVAMGLNERSAILSGVPTVRARTAAFALSGLMAGFTGIILTAQQGTATASGAGIGLLMPAIAAAVAGGCAVTGGVANPFNVLVGALIITLIPIGSSVLGVDPSSQQIVYGVIIVVAVIASLDRSRKVTVK